MGDKKASADENYPRQIQKPLKSEKEPIDPQRIQFYQDGTQKLSEHGGSRLGQRSSRQALQAELDEQRIAAGFKTVAQPRNEERTSRKSGHINVFSPSNTVMNQKKSQVLGFENDKENRKSTERTKRKRSQTGPKSFKKKHLQLVENDYFSNDDKQLAYLKNNTARPAQDKKSQSFAGVGIVKMGTTKNITKPQIQLNSSSTPEFNILQNKLGNKHNSGEYQMAQQTNDTDHKISRRTAQTYLSGLSQGYISNIDNIKLINNCLNTTGPAASGPNSSETSRALLANGGASQNTKKANKSLENLFKTQSKFNLQNNRQNSKGQKQTLSNSPKRQQFDGHQFAGNQHQSNSATLGRKSQGSKSKKGVPQSHKYNSLNQTNSDGKPHNSGFMQGSSKKQNSNNLADLNLFIKTIEKASVEKLEDQMRIFGFDPKSGTTTSAQAQAVLAAAASGDSFNQHGQEKKKKKSLPPQLKLLALNQVLQQQAHQLGAEEPINIGNMNNVTPSNVSHGSNNFATSQLNILNQVNMSSPEAKERKKPHGSRSKSHRERSAEAQNRKSHHGKNGRLSSGRGASSGSAGRAGAVSHQYPTAPMVMTERVPRPATGKQASNEREDKQIKMKSGKNQSKGVDLRGGSALAKSSKNAKASAAAQQNMYQGFNSQMNKTQNLSNATKLNKSSNNIKGNKSQISTQKQSNKQLLMQILGGSTSVRNQDQQQQQNTNQLSGSKGIRNSSGFFMNNTPGSAKGNVTSREKQNILFEMIHTNAQNQGKGAPVGSRGFENTQPVSGISNLKGFSNQLMSKKGSGSSRQQSHQKQSSLVEAQQYLSPQQQMPPQPKAKKATKEDKSGKRDYASPNSGKPPQGSFKPPMLQPTTFF